MDKTLEENRKEIIELLNSKAALKQDIFQKIQEAYSLLRKVLTDEVNTLHSQITDQRIRMFLKDECDSEIKAFVGSDCLIFHMHTNVFQLPEDNPLWETDYMKEDPSRGYFGIIYIYNFLADSILQNRLGDPGYLIERIFVNKENRFFVEGHSGMISEFSSIDKDQLDDKKMRYIIQTAMDYVINFDLLTPPFKMLAQINVQQADAIANANSIKIQTGKRLGFRYEKEGNDIQD